MKCTPNASQELLRYENYMFNIWKQKFNQKLLEIGVKSNMVNIVPCFVVEMNNAVYIVEPYVAGTFGQYNTNAGEVTDAEFATPQVLSHFSAHHTNNTMMLLNLQGVDNIYTSAQVCTQDTNDNKFGTHNLGIVAMQNFFKHHICNALCSKLQLPPVTQQPVSKHETISNSVCLPSCCAK